MSEKRQLIRPSLAPRLLRSDEGGPKRIGGYAAVYYRPGEEGTEYRLYSGSGYEIVERLMRGCFDRAIREGDCIASVNHDPSLILGRLSAGTLRLSTDNIGLKYEVDLPDACYGNDVYESVRRGDYKGSSFQFDYREKTIVEQDDGDMERTILEVRDVDLWDVSVVAFPAYTSTSVEPRHSLGGHNKALVTRAQQRSASGNTRGGGLSSREQINARVRQIECEMGDAPQGRCPRLNARNVRRLLRDVVDDMGRLDERIAEQEAREQARELMADIERTRAQTEVAIQRARRRAERAEAASLARSIRNWDRLEEESRAWVYHQ